MCSRTDELPRPTSGSESDSSCSSEISPQGRQREPAWFTSWTRWSTSAAMHLASAACSSASSFGHGAYCSVHGPGSRTQQAGRPRTTNDPPAAASPPWPRSNGAGVSEHVFTGLVVDIDGTLAGDAVDGDYAACSVNKPMLERLLLLRSQGVPITLQTARNMRTYAGDVGRINAHTMPILLEWLRHHEVPYDAIVVGKPWPGARGLYIDDRAVRPDEFLSSSPLELLELTARRFR